MTQCSKSICIAIVKEENLFLIHDIDKAVGKKFNGF